MIIFWNTKLTKRTATLAARVRGKKQNLELNRAKYKLVQKQIPGQYYFWTHSLCDDFKVNPYEGDMRNFAPFFSILSPIPLF